MTSGEDYYDAVGAWFLGSRGENAAFLAELFQKVLRYQVEARKTFHPEDQSPYTDAMQASSVYRGNLAKLEFIIDKLVPKFASSSVPFFSPRYNGHMNMDTSMPGIIGYLMTMMFNPNNVAVEASPLSTLIEINTGLELSELVGYDIYPGKVPCAWGHITADGSIANLESMWAARNLKFYPLSLRKAMEKELLFIADTFVVPTADGTKKLLTEFSTWELLNIHPPSVLDIPTRLISEYGITPEFLASALSPYSVQTLGKDQLEKDFDIEGPGAYFASATYHYSWPKGAAVTGIGSKNIIGINVNDRARMRIDKLREELDKCLAEQRFVYAVVAIIGSTEHGACDPLDEMVKVREEYRVKGLTFVLHADGAWGTYFASMISLDLQKEIIHEVFPKKWRKKYPDHSVDLPRIIPSDDAFVPVVPLNHETCKAIVCLRFCDSITADPHKSGYVQYPAGGLLYRDQRMRYLVTWTSPIVYRSAELESIGVYGIEGSKPGAAPVAAWCSHQVMGLNPRGYGQLLGEATFSGIKMYAHLVTMSEEGFFVKTLNKIPAEESGGSPRDIEKQLAFIRNRILYVPNRELVEDKEAWKLVKEMGSDLCINAFAANFSIGGQVNTDVVEANYLNTTIFNRLSITKVEDNINDKPLILTSTVLSQDGYDECLTDFKTRLGLSGSQDLYTLVNVVMSPFPTIDDLTGKIANDLKEVIREASVISVYRNTLTNDYHGFIMQGPSADVYLVHLAMFYMENHRMQLVITGDLDNTLQDAYDAHRQEDPEKYFVLGTENTTTLETILVEREFDAVIFDHVPKPDDRPIASGRVSNVQIVVQQDLHTQNLTPYPTDTIPFTLYGLHVGDNHGHIDHVYTAAPNIQLSSENVTYRFQLDDELANEGNFPDDLPGVLGLLRPVILGPNPFNVYAHLPYPEVSMQPFTDESFKNPKFFFQPGMRFENVKFTFGENYKSTKIGVGSLTLGDVVFRDINMLNANPIPPEQKLLVEPESPDRRGWDELLTDVTAKLRNYTTKATESGCQQPEPQTAFIDIEVVMEEEVRVVWR